MTPEASRRDAKSSTTPSQVRQRMRKRARELARTRIIRSEDEAILLTDARSTIAVLLAYSPPRWSVPLLVEVGSGQGAQVLQRRVAARGIPILDVPPLARQLSGLRQGAPVPLELHEVVAEALAQVGKRSVP